MARYKWDSFPEGDFQPCKSMTNKLAPVERNNWVSSAWNFTLRSSCMVRTIYEQLGTSCLHQGGFLLLLHPPLYPCWLFCNRKMSPRVDRAEDYSSSKKEITITVYLGRRPLKYHRYK